MLKKAFTLAEVLLVISIIGIVSALTIPGLVTSSRDEQTVVKLKQVKNDLDLALQKAILKYGAPSEWAYNESDTSKASMIMEFIDSNSSNYFPASTYNSNASYSKYKSKDETYFAIYSTTSAMKVIVGVGGYGNSELGKHIFGFDVNLNEGTVHPFGYNSDVGTSNALSASNNINATNWAISVGNLDYLRCKNSLNWQNKTSCD